MVHRSQRGFTILEVMAAILMAGFLFTAIYGILLHTQEAQARTERTTSERALGRAILSMIARDLSFGYVRGIDGAFRGERGGDVDALHFVTSLNPTPDEQGHTGDFSEVSYVLKPGSQGRNILFRREAVFLGVPSFASVDQTKSPPDRGRYDEVCDRVVKFRFTYYADDLAARESWAEKGPPRALKIEITLAPETADAEGPRKEGQTFVGFFAVP